MNDIISKTQYPVNSQYGGLEQFPRFILLSAEFDNRTGRTKKAPLKSPRYCIKKGNLYNPKEWLPYAEAKQALDIERRYDPTNPHKYFLGFVFTGDSGLFFVDLDDCMSTGNSGLMPWAQKIVNMFDDCYIEISQSGKGVHIIGRKPPTFPTHEQYNQTYMNRVRLNSGEIELYFHKRYVALTGISAYEGLQDIHPGSNSINTIGVRLPELCELHLKRESLSVNEYPFTYDWDSPRPDWNGPKSDDKLIEKMLASRGGASAVFGHKLKFSDLWNCNEEKISNVHPGRSEGTSFDWSSADLSLCSFLAFWTGCHGARMDRLFRTSQLMRAKWDREDYSQRTIDKAIATCSKVYDRKYSKKEHARSLSDVPPPPQAVSSVPLPPVLPGKYDSNMPLFPIQQLSYFKGCVLITSSVEIHAPNGQYFGPRAFNAAYGGPRFKWSDDETDKRSTKKAWDAFTECELYTHPKVRGTYFRPELKSLEILEQEGSKYLNTYKSFPIPRHSGDPALFLELVRRMYPDPREQEILLTYMASMLQCPGKKARWALILQGVRGNGKTTLMDILSQALPDEYVHAQNVVDLGNKFNIWMRDQLLITVEEVKVPGRNLTTFMNNLKPLITNDRIAVQGKGKDQTVIDNRANFLMATNHKDAIPIGEDNRRFCMLAAAQQKKSDLQRSGLTTSFFIKLHKWLRDKNEEGFKIINNYLLDYNIKDSEFNFDVCIDAPVTSVTSEAIELSRSPIEKIIREAIDSEISGFRGDMLSLHQVNRQLKQELPNSHIEKRICHRKVQEILENIGYIPHPNLKDGRATFKIDDIKPRIYVKKDSASCSLKPTEIKDQYLADQVPE